MDIRCTNCGAPFEGTPVDAIITCVFCSHAIRIESPAAHPSARPRVGHDRSARDELKAQLERAMLEARHVQEERARNREDESTAPAPTLPTNSSSVFASAIGISLVVAVGIAVAVWIHKKPASAESMQPTAGVLELATLPTDAPTRTAARVTGTFSADSFGSSCRGYVEHAPTLLLRVREATVVTLETHADSPDPTLALRAPDGAAVCDDDSGEGRNARLTMVLGRGSYPVWIGTLSRGDTFASSLTLEQTRAPGAVEPGVVTTIGNHEAPDIAMLGRIAPTDGIKDVPATPGRLASDGTSGGPLEASRIDHQCRGYIPFAPHVSFRLPAATSLSLTTSSRADMTLLVRGSDGRVRCDDDSGDGNSPLIEDSFPAGRVDVWVGGITDDVRAPFTLLADHEPAPTGALEHGLAIEATSTLGVVDASTLRGVWSRSGTASGRVDARPLGRSCRGELPVVASAVLNVATASDLTVTTRSHADLVMAIRHPDGTWTCDDDTNGNQPSISTSFAPGEHRVWVGPLHMRQPQPFELQVAGPHAAPRAAAPRAAARAGHSGKSVKGNVDPYE